MKRLWCASPPKPTTTTKDGSNAYHSGNTRPLAISNTDNRLLATACRVRWERIACEHVHEHQCGFLPRRSMVANIVDIDHYSHLFALQEDGPTLILYDFTAAFPSISREYTMSALTAFGAPPLVLTTMQNFYQHNNIHLSARQRASESATQAAGGSFGSAFASFRMPSRSS